MDGVASIDRATDFIELSDSSGPTSYKATPNFILGITGAPVGDTDTQTLTNKTLTTPTVSSPVLNGTITGTYTLGGTPTFPASVATLTGTQTLTNKTLTSPTINTATIANPTLTVDTISEFTGSNGVSIDGLNIKDGALVGAVIKNANLDTTDGELGGFWTTFTPSWTDFTLGNGTEEHKYLEIGKTVYVKGNTTLGSTSSVQLSISMTAPVTPNSSYDLGTNIDQSIVGGALAMDKSTSDLFPGTCNIRDGQISIQAILLSGTYAKQQSYNTTIPFTWTTNDQISYSAIYEAA